MPPHTSTEVRDLVPEGEWTAEYLSAQQQADDDLGQVHKWKLGTMEKPSWSVVRGFSPALKAYWQQYDSVVLRTGVLYRSFILGGGRPDVLQFLAPRNLQPVLLELAHADSAGHLAAKKTEGQLQQRAYWYEWKTSVTLYCRNCGICNSHQVKQQLFKEGEAVRVLDQRGYAKRTPKWQLPYSQVGEIVQRLNDVTYIVTAPGWKGSRILHVDKLRRMEAGSIGPGPVPGPSQQADDNHRGTTGN